MSQRLLMAFDAVLRWLFGAVAGRHRRSGVLLVASGGIGDIILFSVAAPHFTRLAEPGESVTLVTQAGAAAAGFLLPPEFRHIPIDYRRFRRDLVYRARTGWRLFRLGARLAIATDYLRHPLADDAFILYSAAPERVCLDPKPWPKYAAALAANLARYTRVVPMIHAPMHKYVRWLHLPAALTGAPLTIPPVYREAAPCPPSDVVVIHPFASTRARQPSAAWFIRLLDHIPDGVRVVLSHGPGDLERNPDFAALAANPRVSLDGSSLEAKAAWLGGARLVVTVDTSLLHLGAISGVPVICIASAAHVIDSVPYDARMNAGNIRFVVGDPDCAGCIGNCVRPLVDDRYPCLDEIAVETVAAVMGEVLA